MNTSSEPGPGARPLVAPGPKENGPSPEELAPEDSSGRPRVVAPVAPPRKSSTGSAPGTGVDIGAAGAAGAPCSVSFTRGSSNTVHPRLPTVKLSASARIE
jgi:hypothetical protein